MNKSSNKVTQFQTKEQIQEQACLWVSRMDRGMSELERKRLIKWCAEHRSHYKTLLRVASYWDNASILSELSGLFPLENIHNSQRKTNRLAIAASFFLATLIGLNTLAQESFLPFLPSYQEYALSEHQRLVSPFGQQISFTTSDGTHIKLNTDSIVDVDYSSRYRKLTLIKGEATFNVAKDTNRPFVVTSDEKSFTALGTIFNVQKIQGDMELMVTEGTVLVTQANQSITQLKQVLLHPKQHKDYLLGFTVTSGEKVLLKPEYKNLVQTVSLDEMNRELAWQQGMLIFDAEPLSSALNEINRYSHIKFHVIDPQISAIKVSGYFETNNIQGLLDSLESNFNIQHEKLGDDSIQLQLSNKS